ncbi:MAG: hypothetical protein ACLFUT_13675 [Desulfobacteraceae bacterium]
MGDIHDAMVDFSLSTGKNNAFKAKIGNIDDVPGLGIMGEDQAEIIRGEQEAFYSAVRAGNEVVRLIEFNGSPALGAGLFYAKTTLSVPMTTPFICLRTAHPRKRRDPALTSRIEFG